MQRVQATVSQEAKEKTTQYGDRVVVDFETEFGEEVSVWSDAEDDEAAFARTLSPGQSVTILKKKGSSGAYYTFTDEQVASVSGEQPQQSQQSTSGGGGQQNSYNRKQQGKETADLAAAIYRRLDQKMTNQNLNNPPSSEELASLTSTIVIQIED